MTAPYALRRTVLHELYDTRTNRIISTYRDDADAADKHLDKLNDHATQPHTKEQ